MIEQSFPALTPVSPAPAMAQTVVLPAPSTEPETVPTQVEPQPEPRRDLLTLASGLGFAALYGLALGARTGGISLLGHALASSAGLAAVGVLGVPSLFVILALLDTPVSPAAMLAASARALGSAGFVLAGLAPSAALLVVTIESADAAAFVARCGLLLGGGIGLYQLVSAVRRMLTQLPLGLRFKSNLLLFGFCVFATLLAARVWYALPILQVAA